MRAEKEDTAVYEEERSGEKAKKKPEFRPAEVIALALAVVFIAAAGFLAVRRFAGGDLVFTPTSSTPKVIETEWIVNINTASAEELMMLDGIGEALANRIIDYRDEHGDFEDIRDITKVSGISQRMFERIYEHIGV